MFLAVFGALPKHKFLELEGKNGLHVEFFAGRDSHAGQGV